jgi:hypothetical protein
MSLVRPITRGDIKGPVLYGAVRDDYFWRVVEHKRARRLGQDELRVLHRRDPVRGRAAGLERGADRMAADVEHDMLVEAEQLLERQVAVGAGRRLEEQRRGQRALGRHELIIDRDLALDLVVAHQALDPANLLDLERQRVAVLEHQRHAVTDEDPARALELDDAPEVVIADRAVQRGPLDVAARDRAHQAHGAGLLGAVQRVEPALEPAGVRALGAR